MKKWLVLFILICVLRVPLPSWKAMTENDRDQLRVMTITEFCRMYAEKYNVRKFSIREEIKDGVFKLHINPIHTEI